MRQSPTLLCKLYLIVNTANEVCFLTASEKRANQILRKYDGLTLEEVNSWDLDEDNLAELIENVGDKDVKMLMGVRYN